MPSAFENLIGSSIDSLYASFGIAATYTDPAGIQTPCTIIVNREPPHQVDRNVRVSGELQTAEIIVRASEVVKVLKNARFAVEGVEVWTVENTPVVKNGQNYCTCSRSGAERMMSRVAKE